ncbi:MAG: flagellar basal-body rod protein FlgF [Bacillota bacterium]
MIRGLYTSASGMMATRRDLNITSNNLANADTDGFKRKEGVKMSFPEMMISRMEKGKRSRELGELGTGVQLDDSYTDFSSGEKQNTGNLLDLAIEGEGFFQVQTPEGIRYTRNGNFTLNSTGEIVTQQGYRLLDEEGDPIQTVSDREISVARNGQIHFEDLEGSRLSVVDFPDREEMLEQVGENLFAYHGEEVEEAEASKIQQGYLEGSNVNIVEEMTRMIETNRLYEAGQKAIQNMDNTLGKAVNDVGNVGR